MPASPPAETPRPGRRPWRAWPALGLLAAVLWLHGLLIGALAPARPDRAGDGQRRAARVQGLPLLVRTVSAPQDPSVALSAGVNPTAPARTAAAPRLDPSVKASVKPSPPSANTLANASASRSVNPAANPSAAEPPADLPSSADPPPVYATRVPPPVLLHYALRYNGRAGEAVLAWRHDGQQYTLTLEGHDAGQPLVAQASQGGFDTAGLAPERFTDRRRGARLTAANFRRDIGRIGFSGPSVEHPAWPGAQDRLSWLAQLAAIRTAAVRSSTAAPTELSLFVVDARGAGGLWRFVAQGEVLLDTPQGVQPAEWWRREPPRPEGLRVEAWLDPAQGHWPLQLRFTALRSGDVFELTRVTAPALSPAPP